jgi:hypothetical protein
MNTKKQKENQNMEASPHIVRRQGPYNRLIEIRSRDWGEKWGSCKLNFRH